MNFRQKKQKESQIYAILYDIKEERLLIFEKPYMLYIFLSFA